MSCLKEKLQNESTKPELWQNVLPVFEISSLTIQCSPLIFFRDKSQGAKLHPEENIQSGEHGLAADHHQISRNQRASV